MNKIKSHSCNLDKTSSICYTASHLLISAWKYSTNSASSTKTVLFFQNQFDYWVGLYIHLETNIIYVVCFVSSHITGENSAQLKGKIVLCNLKDAVILKKSLANKLMLMLKVWFKFKFKFNIEHLVILWSWNINIYLQISSSG